ARGEGDGRRHERQQHGLHDDEPNTRDEPTNRDADERDDEQRDRQSVHGIAGAGHPTTSAATIARHARADAAPSSSGSLRIRSFATLDSINAIAMPSTPTLARNASRANG